MQACGCRTQLRSTRAGISTLQKFADHFFHFVTLWKQTGCTNRALSVCYCSLRSQQHALRCTEMPHNCGVHQQIRKDHTNGNMQHRFQYRYVYHTKSMEHTTSHTIWSSPSPIYIYGSDEVPTESSLPRQDKYRNRPQAEANAIQMFPALQGEWQFPT